jgi:hypothetical protein
MTNTEIVLETFEAMGGSVQHNKALMRAISERFTVAEELARRLVVLTIEAGVLAIDSNGDVRKA